MEVDPNTAVSEVWQDIVVRSVHESNWQEGIFVDRGKTRELALHVFEQLDKVAGPHLDMDHITEGHKRRVVALKRKSASADEIAVCNLSAAHMAVTWIGGELAQRQAASLMYAIKRFENVMDKVSVPPAEREKIDRGFELVDEFLNSDSKLPAPITGGVDTEGLALQQLLHLDFEDLLRPMTTDYIHFLHRIVLMGIADARRCGQFRKKSVHVGNPDLFFAPPSMVPSLMDEFCTDFPTILPTTVKYDPIMMAAKSSHRFARIHPYHDGNGRISRLLMNLVLWGHHPPVYLKADRTGKHRYLQALKRGDRGNVEPLACLIAKSLIEIYEKLLETVGEYSSKGFTI